MSNKLPCTYESTSVHSRDSVNNKKNFAILSKSSINIARRLASVMISLSLADLWKGPSSNIGTKQGPPSLNPTVLTKNVVPHPTPNPLFAPLDPSCDATKLNLQRLQLYKELEIYSYMKRKVNDDIAACYLHASN